METKYQITIRPAADPSDKVCFTMTKDQLDKLAAEVDRVKYDGSYKMKNGDLVEVEVA